MNIKGVITRYVVNTLAILFLIRVASILFDESTHTSLLWNYAIEVQTASRHFVVGLMVLWVIMTYLTVMKIVRKAFKNTSEE